MAKKRPKPKTLLRDILETVNEGVVIFDADDKLVVCNSRYKALYAPIADKLVSGATSESLYRAWGALGLFDPDDGPVDAQVEARLAKHRDPKGPFELHTIERSLRIFERVTEDGYNIGIHTDITAWKRMERAFHEYEGQLPGAIRRGADRFWTMDADLRFTTLVDYPNSRIIASPNNYIGYTRWEAVGADPDTDELWRRHRDDLLARRPFEDFRYTSDDGFGGVYHMSVSGAPQFDENGEFIGYNGTTTQIGADAVDRESEDGFDDMA